MLNLAEVEMLKATVPIPASHLELYVTYHLEQVVQILKTEGATLSIQLNLLQERLLQHSRAPHAEQLWSSSNRYNCVKLSAGGGLACDSADRDPKLQLEATTHFRSCSPLAGRSFLLHTGWV